MLQVWEQGRQPHWQDPADWCVLCHVKELGTWSSLILLGMRWDVTCVLDSISSPDHVAFRECIAGVQKGVFSCLNVCPCLLQISFSPLTELLWLLGVGLPTTWDWPGFLMMARPAREFQNQQEFWSVPAETSEQLNKACINVPTTDKHTRPLSPKGIPPSSSSTERDEWAHCVLSHVYISSIQRNLCCNQWCKGQLVCIGNTSNIIVFVFICLWKGTHQLITGRPWVGTVQYSMLSRVSCDMSQNKEENVIRDVTSLESYWNMLENMEKLYGHCWNAI